MCAGNAYILCGTAVLAVLGCVPPFVALWFVMVRTEFTTSDVRTGS
jgi:hypothetical protein